MKVSEGIRCWLEYHKLHSKKHHQNLPIDPFQTDYTECTTINDLIIARGHEIPENHPLTMLEGFSTVSDESEHNRINRTSKFFLTCRFRIFSQLPSFNSIM